MKALAGESLNRGLFVLLRTGKFALSRCWLERGTRGGVRPAGGEFSSGLRFQKEIFTVLPAAQ